MKDYENKMRQSYIDRMIAVYGANHPNTIEYIKMVNDKHYKTCFLRQVLILNEKHPHF